MLAVFQVDLEVAHRRLWPWCIELAGAIVASYPGKIHPFYAIGRGLTGRRRLARCARRGIHSRVLHRALKVIGGVLC
jgi:hypothetical protein